MNHKYLCFFVNKYPYDDENPTKKSYRNKKRVSSPKNMFILKLPSICQLQHIGNESLHSTHITVVVPKAYYFSGFHLDTPALHNMYFKTTGYGSSEFIAVLRAVVNLVL